MNAFGLFNFLIPTFSLPLMDHCCINKFCQYLVVDVLLSLITH